MRTIRNPQNIPLTDEQVDEFLRRHYAGDWGTFEQDDVILALNARAQEVDCPTDEQNVISAFTLDPNKPAHPRGSNTVWVITENRFNTTMFMHPGDF